MSKPRIDQLLAGFGDGDATSNAAMALRDAIRTLGYDSDIYAPPAHVSPTLREDCRPLESCAPAPADVTILHYGIASPATAVFTAARNKKILIYHNVTPAEYFDGYDDDLAGRLRAARAELRDAARGADAVWAVSSFNASELESLGVSNVVVFELPFSSKPLVVPPDPEILRRIAAPLRTILFVGRIAPNKRVEDLCRAFAWYHRTIDPHSRLLVVGSHRSCPRYMTMLRMLAGDLQTPNICFEGFASPAGLATYYDLADLFVCTSDHEGYCLPLLEAMYKEVPVIAKRTGGTPEAMDGAGVLYQDLSHPELAELMHVILSDDTLRNEILAAQTARVQRALSRDLSRELRERLAAWIPA